VNAATLHAGDDARTARPAAPARLAIRAERRFAIVPTHAIVHVVADDNCVTIVADRCYRTRATLASLCRQLVLLPLVRVHRSHAVNAAAVRDLAARSHGEYELRLADGTRVRSGRRYRDAVRSAFGLDVSLAGRAVR
jgi:two-component system LytT family response regulator